MPYVFYKNYYMIHIYSSKVNFWLNVFKVTTKMCKIFHFFALVVIGFKLI